MSDLRWKRIEEIFHAAVELSPEARAAYLRQACGPDQSLLQEAESLLAHESEDGSTFLEPPKDAAPQSIAHYRITGKLGEGGMGVVYRATDTKLGRDVAIKVLPAAFADDSDAMARFEREAKILASLNHPNIAAIYGVEDRALIMELVEGQNLSGPLPLATALNYAAQIAGAIDAAHEKGIVHRDLKPANIRITPDGVVKVLDFGLAKAAPPRANSENSSTATQATQVGTIMGTAAYMAPEQARGQIVDKRADIWAFGAVLFEMLSGKRAFGGATVSDSIAAVLAREPDFGALPEETPPHVRQLLEHCLRKNPKLRLRDIGDAGILLDQTQPEVPAARRQWIAWAVAAVLVAGFVTGLGAWILTNRRPAGVENPLSGAEFTRLTDFDGFQTKPAISPDGKFVAFISDRSGAFEIWLSETNGGSLSNLSQGRLGDVRAPLRAIGFSGNGGEVWSGGVQGNSGSEGKRLRLLPLVGGAPRNFLGEHAAEVAWSPDGARVVYHVWDPGDATFVADHNGAQERQIVKNAPGMHNHFQVWSKDGRWIYFARGRPATREMDLWRVSPEGGEPEQLTHRNTDIADPTPIDARTILFVAHDQDGAGPWLWAYDTETHASTRVSLGLDQYTAIAATADGRRLVASVVNSQVNLWSLPISGRLIEERDVKAFPLPTTRAHAPRFGGESLFYLSSRSGADGLWSYRKGQALEIWKGSEGALQSPPAVSPDGKWIAIPLKRDAKWQMHVIAADGTQIHPLSGSVDVRGAASWSPRGDWIVSAGRDLEGEGLFKIPANGGMPVRLAKGAFLDPVWSPRGDLIVYGGTQVFTSMPLQGIHPDGTAAKLPEINVRREGERAAFLPDGTGLVYMLGSNTEEQDFWLLDLATMRSRRLTHLSHPAIMQSFDVTPDGKQIVFDRISENSNIVLIDLAPTRTRP